MKLVALSVLAFLVTAPAVTSAQKTQAQDPVAWGMLSGNTGCVIFAEGHKTSGMFWGVAITTKTVGKLTLIETENYNFNQKQVLETQDNMNNLMTMAEKDRVKFVKIPEKYSPDLLDKARASCKAAAAQ